MANVRDFSRLALVVLVVALVPLLCCAQIVEPNVNMVAGTTHPGGDPFLQRQNEGSLAISTRFSMRLFACSNDYRSVDILFDEGTRPDGEQTGDAWIGCFQTWDAGRSWRSVLMDGYPQQTFSNSVLHGFQAAADPVVRAADHGLFHVAGIVLNREPVNNPLSGVFVATFIDNNNSETADTIVPVNTVMIEKGSPGQFVDKPWIAVAKQPNGMQCTVNGQTFPGQNVYMGYTIFVGNDNNIRSKMMFTRSTDCGATWSSSIKLSETYAINQGLSLAVDPTSGTIYAVWRRFKNNNDPDSIILAKSTDQGKTFTKGTVVTNIIPFEQGTTPSTIRTNAYPSITVDNTGRLYLVWAQRSGPICCGATGVDGRIMIMSSPDGVSWSPAVQVDPSLASGHQFMPSITATGNKLTIAYYDLREDSTLGQIASNGSETRVPKGDLASSPPQPQYVFTTYLQEIAHHRRHTIDVRAAQAATGPMPNFISTRVSRYRFGTLPGSMTNTLDQLQLNPPNYPLFRQGTVPFFSDYIDIAGYGGQNGGNANTANTASVQYAVWTDNRDVRPPLDGDWTHYTPVGLTQNRSSVFNGGPVPDCVPGQTGMRNQNIYSTRITEGLFAGAGANFKQLNIQRAFAVFVQNATKDLRTYHLEIVAPPGTTASFLQTSVQLTLDISVTPRTTATRTVFVGPSADQHASVTVKVTETNTPSPLTTTVPLNPDVSNPDVSNPDVSNNEEHTPDVSNPDVSNPDVSNGNFMNPDVSNPDVSNPDVSNPDVSNPDVSNPDVSNPDVSNPDVSNPDVSNPDVSNSSLTDTTWTAKNKGKTTTGYNVKMVSNGPPMGIKTQLIINRIYQTPVARNCTLGVENQRQILANIPNPKFSDGGDLLDPLAKEKEGTFWLAPNDTARITLRVFDSNKNDNITFDPAAEVQTVIVSQAINTNGQTPPLATGLAITTKTIPGGMVGQPYGFPVIEGPPLPVVLQAVGGVGPPYTWAAVSGLPAGLSIGAQSGVISGAPTTTGDYLATFNVKDSTIPAHVATRTFPIHIAPPPPLLQLTTNTVNDGVTNSPYSTQFNATSGTPPYSWSLKGGTPLSINGSGLASGTYTTPGDKGLSVTVTDSSNPPQVVTRGYTVHIADPLVITTTSLPNADQGFFYTTTLASTGGIAPIHWSIASGSVPDEMTLSDSGVISGICAFRETPLVKFRATDSSNPPQIVLSDSGLAQYNGQMPLYVYSAICGAQVTELYTNSNTDAVQNGGNPSTFSTNGQTYCLSSIVTYHWNNAQGATPGSIGLLFNPTNRRVDNVSPWFAVGSPGQNEVPNANWTAQPLVNGERQFIVLNGSYTVLDSDPATWSQNAGSNGFGFIHILVNSATRQSP